MAEQSDLPDGNSRSEHNRITNEQDTAPSDASDYDFRETKELSYLILEPEREKDSFLGYVQLRVTPQGDIDLLQRSPHNQSIVDSLSIYTKEDGHVGMHFFSSDDEEKTGELIQHGHGVSYSHILVEDAKIPEGQMYIRKTTTANSNPDKREVYLTLLFEDRSDEYMIHSHLQEIERIKVLQEELVAELKERLALQTGTIDALMHDLTTDITSINLYPTRFANAFDKKEKFDKLNGSFKEILTRLVRTIESYRNLDLQPMSLLSLENKIGEVANSFNRTSHYHEISYSSGISTEMSTTIDDDSVDGTDSDMEARMNAFAESYMLEVVPNGITRVLGNLIENAIKYSPPTPDKPRPRVMVNFVFDANASRIVIEVSDEGIGISEEYLARIFEKSFRVPDTAEHINGTGMGLYHTKKLVELMGGEFFIQSEVDAGSKFTVSLPA